MAHPMTAEAEGVVISGMPEIEQGPGRFNVRKQACS